MSELTIPYKYPEVLRTIKPTIMEVDGVKIAMSPNTDISFRSITNPNSKKKYQRSYEPFENSENLQLPLTSQGYIIFYNR